MKTIKLHDYIPLGEQEMKSIAGGFIHHISCGCSLYKMTVDGIKEIELSEEQINSYIDSSSSNSCHTACSSLCYSVSQCCTYDFSFTATGSKYMHV